jgi:putative RNA 2'-phosphotransferase
MKDLKTISKFLSLVLRHQPEEIGIYMDNNGWVHVDELILKSNEKGMAMDSVMLEEVVSTNDKQRFVFNEDHTKIRASQGHSVNVDLQLNAVQPPEYLYHGTVEKFLGDIMKDGLRKMQRTHVHLSTDIDTAAKVGSRRGKPIILTVHAGDMHSDGHIFYLSENVVWLCDHVPVKYIKF